MVCVVNVLDIVCRLRLRCEQRAVRGPSGMTQSMRVTIGDVADRAGVSIATVSRVVNGRYGVSTATLERVQRGDRRPRLRVEPGGQEPAQPTDQRDRDPRRRHRAVQRRAPQGCRQGAPRLRLRDGRLCRRPAQQRRLGAALRLAPERHAHRRHDPRHTDGDRRRLHATRCRRRPPRRRIGAAHDRLPELRGRQGDDRPSDRARTPPDRLHRRPPRPRIGAASRSRLSGRSRACRHRLRPRSRA